MKTRQLRPAKQASRPAIPDPPSSLPLPSSLFLPLPYFLSRSPLHSSYLFPPSLPLELIMLPADIPMVSPFFPLPFLPPFLAISILGHNSHYGYFPLLAVTACLNMAITMVFMGVFSKYIKNADQQPKRFLKICVW